VKIDIENTKRASDVTAIKWKKTAKICDQGFLATGIPPWPIHQELLTILGSNAALKDLV
jgi:hypothetical protein